MRIQNLLTLVLFLVGTTTYAADPFDITNDIFKCRAHHNTNIVPGNNDLSKADAWCKTTMGPVMFCAEQELLKILQKGSLSQDQLIALRPQLKYKCASNPASVSNAAAPVNSAQSAQLSYAQGAQQAQLDAAKAAAEKEAAAKTAAANAAQANKDKQNSLQQSAQILGAIAPAVGKAEEAYNKAVKAEVAKEDGKPEPIPVPSGITTPLSGNVAGGIQDAVNKVNKAIADGPPDTASRSVAGKTDAAATPETPAAADYSKMNDAEFAAAMKKEQAATDAAIGRVPAESAATKAEMPGVAGAAEQGEQAMKTGDKVDPPPSIHTTSAKTADGEMKTKLTAVSTKAEPVLSTPAPAMAFTATAAMLKTDLMQAHTAYAETVKPTCITLTEKTEFLCLEGTSPGAAAAKSLVSSAGPILAAVNSAQKACSNTSKITGLAGTLLTAAKGICMASQGACTLTCGAALTKWTGSITALVAKIQTQAQADASLAETDCYEKGEAAGEAAAAASMGAGYMPAFQAVYGPCKADVAKKAAAVKAALTEIQTVSKTEAVPATPGTSAGLAAKCKLKITDAIMMAANVASLMMAKKNADECDKKLSTAGTAGAGATVTQYCETPANTNTQFCTCQKNPNQEGCPGFTAATPATEQQKAEQQGLNLKGVGGKASFAGSGNNSTTKPTGALGDVPTSGAGGGSDPLSLNGAGPGSTGGAGEVIGGNSPSAGLGKAGGSGSGSDAATIEREKKKWDFGSFASSVGSFFGGSKGGSRGNGSLSNTQKDAIERKIASDKLSGEISSASGKSNWEKIRQAYLIKENTLLSGQ